MTPIVVRTEDVRAAIIAARGLNVMLDSDLARLYQVQTSALVRAMKRNQDRFPNDFAFQLTREEWDDLLCQTGISSSYGGRRTPPFVFTEQGVAMLSGVLRSERAVAVNVAIMRAFVAMRHELSGQLELARKLDKVEQALGALERTSEEKFRAVFSALRALLAQPQPSGKALGFAAEFKTRDLCDAVVLAHRVRLQLARGRYPIRLLGHDRPPACAHWWRWGMGVSPLASGGTKTT